MKHAIINKWFEEAFAGTSVVAFVLDSDMRYVAVVNSLAVGGEDAFIGKTPFEVFSGYYGSDELCAAYQRVHDGHGPAKVEFMADGIWFDIVLKQTELPSGQLCILGIATDITKQKIALREQAHRTKNAFTMAMAMASHTARSFDIPLGFKQKLHARLEALSKSQDAVSQGAGVTTFHTLISSQMGHAISAEPDRFSISEDDCKIDGDLAQYITLAIYELFTNATKYGSLSNDTGTVEIACSNHDGMLKISWTEIGGPEPEVDCKSGFGRVLVTSVIPKATKGAGTFEMLPTGLKWTLTAPQISEPCA